MGGGARSGHRCIATGCRMVGRGLVEQGLWWALVFEVGLGAKGAIGSIIQSPYQLAPIMPLEPSHPSPKRS